jgi:hypothetical protein
MMSNGSLLQGILFDSGNTADAEFTEKQCAQA